MGRGKSDTVEAVAVFGAYAALALWWLWPLPLVAGDHLLYLPHTLNDADIDLGTWTAAWVTHALQTEPWRVFDANSFYPAPFSLAYSEHFFGQIPFFAPTYLATGNPILAINGYILLMYGLSGTGLYLLARRFVSAPAAFLGGLLFTFYPTRLSDLSQCYMLATGFLPLAMYFTEKWLAGGRKRDAIGLAISLALQLLSSFYLAYAAALAYGLYLLLALLRLRLELDRRRLIGLLLTVAAASTPLLLSSVPYLLLRRWGFIPDYSDAGSTALGLLAWTTHDFVFAHFSTAGVGACGVLLAAIGLLPPWRGQRWPRILSVSLAALGGLLAFGPEIAIGPISVTSPYALLQDWVPGFASLRASRRFLVVAQLGLALLVALGLDRLVSGRSLRTAWTGALVAALFSFSTFPALPPVALHARPVGDEIPPAYGWLAEHGEGRPLLELPAANFATSARRMYLSHRHWLPLLQGYSGYPPAAVTYLQKLASGLPARESVTRLTDVVDVGWILVHLDEMGGRAAAWRKPLPPGLEKAATFGDDLLVRVNRRATSDPRAQLFDRSQTMGGVLLESVGPDCPGEIQLASPIPSVVPTRLSLTLRVTIDNHGEQAWPGLSFASPHVVQLMACVGARNKRCQTAGKPLYADVPAGGQIRVDQRIRMPGYPGDYDLWIGLDQPADGLLERCGVAPLRVPIRAASRLRDGPLGGYWQTCENCDFDGTTLTCDCRTRSGEFRNTQGANCSGFYENDDGRLFCRTD